MLTLQQIIDEADILAPNNGLDTANKVLQLTILNREFFEIVKIPKIQNFVSTAASTVVLANDVREKNIDYVQLGFLRYRSLDGDDVRPLQNVFAFDDVTHTLTLSPAPYQSGLQGIVRYRSIGTATFTSGNLSAAPEAPEEYHGSFIPALASYLAAAIDDADKATKYEAMYKADWNAAAQAYAAGRTTP